MIPASGFVITGDVTQPVAGQWSFASTNSYGNYIQNGPHNWTNQDAMFKIVSFPLTIGNKLVFEARGSTGGRIEIMFDSSGARRVNMYAGATYLPESNTFDWSGFPFWKIGWVSGTMYFWRSTDGVTWITHATYAHPAPTSSSLRVNGYNSTATSDRIVISNLNTPPSTNTAPTANAGADRTASVGETVTVTGSGVDSDGTIASYNWTLTSKPATAGAVLNGTGATRTLTPDRSGVYTLSLTVTDDDGAVSAADTMTITAQVVANLLTWDPAKTANDLPGDPAIAKYRVEGFRGENVVLQSEVQVPTTTYRHFVNDQSVIYRVAAVDVNGVLGPWSETVGFSGTPVVVDDKITGFAAGTELTWESSPSGWQQSSVEHYSSVPGSWRKLYFRGTGVALHGTMDAHHGDMLVKVDSGAAVSYSTYSPTRQVEALIVNITGLADTDHVVEVSVAGTKDAASTGTVVAIDYGVVLSTGSTEPPEVVVPPPSASEEVIYDQDFSQLANQTNYITTGKNRDPDPWSPGEWPWYLETGGRSPLNIEGGYLVKPNATEDYHRFWLTPLIYGLGKKLTVEMFDTSGDIGPSTTNSVPGLKISPYYMNPNHPNPGDPRSVNDMPSSSLQSFTGVTAKGRLEISNQVWETRYRFSYQNGVPVKEPGYPDWKVYDLKTTFEFFTNSHIRTRQYQNGVLVYEWDDPAYPIGAQNPFFLRFRSDDCSWKTRRIRVTLTDIP